MSNRLSIENISTIILELFVVKDGKDVRITLNPGDKDWCDVDSSTKSMILYERKHLIKISNDVNEEIKKDTIVIDIIVKPQAKVEYIETNITILPTSTILNEDDSFTEEEKATGDSEESDTEKKEPKKYKGKKRGRKKKRGPKPGAKKKKAAQLPTMTEFNPSVAYTGTTN